MHSEETVILKAKKHVLTTGLTVRFEKMYDTTELTVDRKVYFCVN